MKTDEYVTLMGLCKDTDEVHVMLDIWLRAYNVPDAVINMSWDEMYLLIREAAEDNPALQYVLPVIQKASNMWDKFYDNPPVITNPDLTSPNMAKGTLDAYLTDFEEITDGNT